MRCPARPFAVLARLLLAAWLLVAGGCGWPYDNPLDQHGSPEVRAPKKTFWMGFPWPWPSDPSDGETELRLQGCVGGVFPRSAGKYTADSTFEELCRNHADVCVQVRGPDCSVRSCRDRRDPRAVAQCGSWE